MASARKILIADPDPATVRALGPALRSRGWQVHAARDGSKALEVAILRYPDLVLFDERAPLIDARTFVRILRTNPRTEQIPVVVTGESVDLDRGRHGAFLKKPFNQDEVLSRIEQIFRKVEAARAVSGDSRDIEGNLAQIPLVDLLQILGVNRKTGRLAIEREGERAEVTMKEGRAVDAQAGGARGEKAMYRLLTRREGQFAFLPGGVEGAPETIAKKLDELVLEGMRQADEVARIAPALPPRSQLVELAVAPAEIPQGLHPVTAEVVALLDRPLPFGELVDRAGATDLEAMRAVLALLERGFARRREGGAEQAAEPAPVLGPAELHALRARIAKGKTSGSLAIGKVVLVGGGPLARRAALARVAALPGWAVERAPGGGFGMLGRLALGEGVRVDLIELPGDAAMRPLWRPFATGALGVLVLLPAEGMDPLLAELSRDLRLPVVVSGPREAPLPRVLDNAPGGVARGGGDAGEALRALLVGAGMRQTSY